MNQIFDLIDAMGVSREAIQVALVPKGEGSVERGAGGKFLIAIPATIPLADWIGTLRARIEELSSGKTP